MRRRASWEWGICPCRGPMQAACPFCPGQKPAAARSLRRGSGNFVGGSALLLSLPLGRLFLLQRLALLLLLREMWRTCFGHLVLPAAWDLQLQCCQFAPGLLDGQAPRRRRRRRASHPSIWIAASWTRPAVVSERVPRRTACLGTVCTAATEIVAVGPRQGSRLPPSEGHRPVRATHDLATIVPTITVADEPVRTGRAAVVFPLYPPAVDDNTSSGNSLPARAAAPARCPTSGRTTAPRAETRRRRSQRWSDHPVAEERGHHFVGQAAQPRDLPSSLSPSSWASRTPTASSIVAGGEVTPSGPRSTRRTRRSSSGTSSVFRARILPPSHDRPIPEMRVDGDEVRGRPSMAPRLGVARRRKAGRTLMSQPGSVNMWRGLGESIPLRCPSGSSGAEPIAGSRRAQARLQSSVWIRKLPNPRAPSLRRARRDPTSSTWRTFGCRASVSPSRRPDVHGGRRSGSEPYWKPLEPAEHDVAVASAARKVQVGQPPHERADPVNLRSATGERPSRGSGGSRSLRTCAGWRRRGRRRARRPARSPAASSWFAEPQARER